MVTIIIVFLDLKRFVLCYPLPAILILKNNLYPKIRIWLLMLHHKCFKNRKNLSFCIHSHMFVNDAQMHRQNIRTLDISEKSSIIFPLIGTWTYLHRPGRSSWLNEELSPFSSCAIILKKRETLIKYEQISR